MLPTEKTTYTLEYKECTRPKWAQVVRSFLFDDMYRKGRDIMRTRSTLKLEPDKLYEVSIKL